MRHSYRQLFSVECLHGYFADHICRTLTWAPTLECARLLARCRMIFKPAAGGGTVYCEQTAEAPSLPDAQVPFAFMLTSTDPLLDTYTDGDLGAGTQPVDAVHYFSNGVLESADLYGQPRLLMHPPSQPFAQPALELRARRFMHRFDAPVQGTVRIVDAARGTCVWTAAGAGERVAVAVDLRGCADGRYALTVDGAVALDFYLVEAARLRPWALVEILANELQFAAGPSTFTVALEARKTVWRYYIFAPPPARERYADYLIVDETPRGGGSPDRIGFTPMAAPVMRNGRDGVVFESVRPVALREAPTAADCLFLYKPNGRNPGRSIALPFARPAMTRLEIASDSRTMCSEIFVYI
jgi:hypothetical protein